MSREKEKLRNCEGSRGRKKREKTPRCAGRRGAPGGRCRRPRASGGPSGGARRGSSKCDTECDFHIRSLAPSSTMSHTGSYHIKSPIFVSGSLPRLTRVYAITPEKVDSQKALLSLILANLSLTFCLYSPAISAKAP